MTKKALLSLCLLGALSSCGPLNFMRFSAEPDPLIAPVDMAEALAFPK